MENFTEALLQIDVQLRYTILPTLGHLTEVWLVPDGVENQKAWRYIGGIYNDDEELGTRWGRWYAVKCPGQNYDLRVTQAEDEVQVTKSVSVIQMPIYD